MNDLITRPMLRSNSLATLLDWDFPLISSFENRGLLKVDIKEDDKNIYIDADVPGVNKDNIEITFNDNHLSLSVKSTNEQEEKEGEKIIRKERYYQELSRTIKFSRSINEAEISATCKDGVLTVVLPKIEEENSIKKIAIA